MSQKSQKSFSKMSYSLSAHIENMTRYFRLTTVVYFPVLLSIIVLIVGFMIGEQVYQETIFPQRFIGTIFLIMSLVASISGFMQITLKETPGLIVPVHGKAAIVLGTVWILFFWMLALGIVWYYLL